MAQQPSANPAQLEATIDEAVEMFVKIGKVVMDAKSNCDVMATNVGAWLDTNGETRKRINATLIRIQSEEMKERYRAGLSAHLDVVMGMKAALEGCEAHRRFMTVWRRFDR